MKNDMQKKKEPVKMTSEEFRSYRYSYGMSQKEWAEAVGVSPALVKMIETDKQSCSVKTAEKVWEFIGSGSVSNRNAGLKGLEERILYDIFLEHMDKLDEKEAAGYAAKCVRPLRKVISKASECSSPDAQKKYFDFVEMLLSAMHLASSEYIGMANGGKPVSDIRMELIEFLYTKIKMMKHEEGISLSGSQDEGGQCSLFSFMDD